MRARRPATVVTAAVSVTAAAALLTACGTSGSTDGTQVGAHGAGAATVASDLADSPTLLRASDLPSGFTVTGPASSQAPAAATDDALHDCLGAPRTSGHRTGGAVSPSFRTGSATSTRYRGVSSAIVRYRSQADVEAERNLYSAGNAETCVGRQFDAQFDRFLEGRRVLHRSLEVRPGSNDGPSDVAAIVSETVEYAGSDGGAQTFEAELIVLTGPKSVANLLLLGVGEQFDGDLATRLETTLATRVARG